MARYLLITNPARRTKLHGRVANPVQQGASRGNPGFSGGNQAFMKEGKTSRKSRVATFHCQK